MPWDPDQYLRFADARMRPGAELAARIPRIEPRSLVDLGAGTGELTARLSARWPAASVIGLDASREMIERARRDFPGISWQEGDIADWEPSGPLDLIFSNATLHWLDAHPDLFRRLRSYLAPGGVLAVQMPDNWAEPTHRVPAEILDSGRYPEAAATALLRHRLADPADYARWMDPAEVDIWRTTYFQRLAGPDPAWNWVTGSLLRPVVDQLRGTDRASFEAECKARYLAAYPPASDGSTTLPFSRLFIVAQAPNE